jgi:hypothetical protein
MEAALLSINLVFMLALVIWSARVDPPGKQLSGRGLFDTRPGAACDHRKPPGGNHGHADLNIGL